MPPRRSACLTVPAAPEPQDARTALPLALPPSLARRVWGSLRPDVRMRCREVCPAWRDALAEPRLWTELDFITRAHGYVQVTPALLLAAAARACGQLERLYVPYNIALQPALLAVLTTNPASLRILRLSHYSSIPHATLEELMRAVPRLCVVEADIYPSYDEARAMLRNESPFEALRLRELRLSGESLFAISDVATLPADLVAHPSLRELTLLDAQLGVPTGVLDELVDAALALRLTKLNLQSCVGVTAASAGALQRLLRGDALLELKVSGRGKQLLNAHAADLLADALRSNSTLTSLELYNVDLWRDIEAATTLFEALIGHASLTSIHLNGHESHGAAAAIGELIGALVEADAPSLRELDVSSNELGDDGMLPLVDALPANTHLRWLRCGNGMSGVFARERLKPAADGFLLVIDADDEDEEPPKPWEETAECSETLRRLHNSDAALTSLDLEGCNIGDNGMQQLADCLRVNTTLTSLDLSVNVFGDDGMARLGACLRVNTALTSLQLNDNSEFGDEGAVELGACLRFNTALTTIILHHCNIGDKGAASFADGLRENTTLTRLDLNGNCIRAEGAEQLAECLRVNTTLTSLDISHNLSASAAGWQLIQERLIGR